jgi:hypothetical protein
MQLFNLIYSGGPNRLWIFLLVTVVMGGSTAFVSGRTIAATWRPFWHALVYALVIGLAARFIQFALFEAPLVSAGNYLIDCVILLLAAIWGYVATRKVQMVEQYGPLTAETVAAAPKDAG